MIRALLFISLLGSTLCAADAQEGTWENNLALNYKLDEWKFNTSFGHRAAREKSGETLSNRLVFLEINQFITRKISPTLSVSVGYKYRDVKREDAEQRLTQQIALIHQRSYIRLVSRLRLEQRFRGSFAHRYRYRFSVDLPLSGRKLDVKEAYLLASNEIVFQRSDTNNQVDNRITIGIGYIPFNVLKLQAEFTHRMEKLNTAVDHRPFITTSAFFNIN